MTDMSASTMAMSTVQTLDFGGVQLIRRDVADSIEAIEAASNSLYIHC